MNLLAVYGAASLAAVALGWLICSQSGVPIASTIRNVVAWIVGGLAAVAMARWAGQMALKVALVAAPLALGASLLNPGQDGVHRWLDIGPLHVNVAFIVLPAAVVGLAVLGSKQRWPWLAAFAALALLVVQPDASQATALALAMIAIAWVGSASTPLKGLATVAASALAAFAWLRPDPLLPVAEVEEVIGLAWDLSPAVAAVAVVALAMAVLVPTIAASRGGSDARVPSLALALYFAVTALAPSLGAFPVPLVGIGMSAILGYWLGVGLLASSQRATVSDASASPASGS